MRFIVMSALQVSLRHRASDIRVSSDSE